MENYIKRDRYLAQLINRKENGLIKVITGIRRCGKSFLLFNLYYDYLIRQLQITWSIYQNRFSSAAPRDMM